MLSIKSILVCAFSSVLLFATIANARPDRTMNEESDESDEFGLKRFGGWCDGSNDDTPAVVAAYTAGGCGRRDKFP